MKKLLILFAFLLLGVLASGQNDVRPVATSPISFLQVPTYSWWYNKADSTIWGRQLNNSQIPEWVKLVGANRIWWTQIEKIVAGDTTFNRVHNRDSVDMTIYKLKDDSLKLFKLKTDSITLKGYFTNSKARFYRLLNNHDSLSTLDERKYQSLTDTLLWGLGLSQLHHTVKVDTADISIPSRQRIAKYYRLINDTIRLKGTATIFDLRSYTLKNDSSKLYKLKTDSITNKGYYTNFKALSKKDLNDSTDTDGYTRRDRFLTGLNTKFGGSGTANYLQKATAVRTLGNSLIQDAGTGVFLFANSVLTPTLKSVDNNIILESENWNILLKPAAGKMVTIPTGSGLDISGTVKATTGLFTNLTDGYMPYHISDAAGQANSPFYTNGTSAALGGTDFSLGKFQVNVTTAGGVVVKETAYSGKATLGLIEEEGDMGLYNDGGTRGVRLSAYYDNYINPSGGGCGIILGGTNANGYKVYANGTLGVATSVTAPTILLTTGAQINYIWKSTGTTGAGAWAAIAASQVYKGTWNAATNTPTLADGTGTGGWYYRCETAGTVDFDGAGARAAITFAVGDEAHYNGTIWEYVKGVGYTLQTATASVLGGIKVGGSLQINTDVLNVNNYDMGDITVSGTGTDVGRIWAIDAGTVTLAKMANMNTAKVLGRMTALAGVVEELAVSGTGNVAMTTSPTFITPLLGTPTSGNLANCTFPTLNQSTTGNSATTTLAANSSLLENHNAAYFQTALTNPYTGTGAAGQVAFHTGTSTLSGDNGLFWDNVNKRLGIGTTNPLAKLDVAGNILTRNSLGNALGYLAEEVDNSGTLYLYNNGTIKNVLSTNGNSYINGGNVGIGLISPTAVVHIKAGTATAGTAPLKFTSGVLNTIAEAGAVEFLTDVWYGTITTGAARKTFAFLESPLFTGTVTMPVLKVTTGAGLNKVLLSDADGLLSYSASALGSAAYTASGDYATASALTTHANLTTTAHGLGASAFHADNFFATAAQANATHTGDVTGATALTLATVTVPKGGTGLTTLTDESVIIGQGTATPTFVAPGTAGNVLTSYNGAWASRTPTGGSMTYPSGTGVAVVQNGTSWTTTLGYASANTASALVQRDGSGDFAAHIITATNFQLSDSTLKRNILPLTKFDFDKAGKIQFHKFTFKDDKLNKPHIGIIAQELERVMPELVKTDEITGIKSVNYTEMLVILVAQQDEEIKLLKEQNKAFEKRLEKLEKK